MGANSALVVKPKVWTCVGGQFSWWDISITGYVGVRSIHTKISTCWTPQMAMIGRLLSPSPRSSDVSWRTLRAHLLPRRRVTLHGKTRKTFAPGVLHPGDLVTCRYRGRKLDLGVGDSTGRSAETGYNGVGVTPVWLTVTYSRDTSVTAWCR